MYIGPSPRAKEEGEGERNEGGTTFINDALREKNTVSEIQYKNGGPAIIEARACVSAPARCFIFDKG